MRADQLTIDRDAYLGIAKNVATGNGFSTPGSTAPTAYRPPLYPLILSAVMTVLPAAPAVAVLNIVAGCLTVWLVSRLGDALGMGPTRHLAALCVAIDPLLLNATAQPMTEVVFTALTMAWLWGVTPRGDCENDFSWRRAAWTGLYFGLAALCRPTIWPLAGLMGLAWCFSPATRRGRRREWRLLVTTATVTLLVVSPWVIRNQRVFGRPILMTTHGGYTLLLANNSVYFEEVVQQPWGTTWSGESLSLWQTDVEQKMRVELGASQGEIARDAWMSSEAKRYIAHHPTNFFQAMGHRIRSLWSISPQGEGASLPVAIRVGVAVFYGLEYIAALGGLWLMVRRRQWRAWLPCLLLIVAVQGVHLVYWTDARMRSPLQPVLALLAASARAAKSCQSSQLSNAVKTSG